MVGRQRPGGADVAAPDQVYDEIAKATTGRPVLVVPKSELGRNVGGVTVDVSTKKPTLARISEELTSPKREMVRNHEVGHVIDQEVGE